MNMKQNTDIRYKTPILDFGVNYQIGGHKDHRLQRYENSDVRNNTLFRKLEKAHNI